MSAHTLTPIGDDNLACTCGETITPPHREGWWWGERWNVAEAHILAHQRNGDTQMPKSKKSNTPKLTAFDAAFDNGRWVWNSDIPTPVTPNDYLPVTGRLHWAAEALRQINAR